MRRSASLQRGGGAETLSGRTMYIELFTADPEERAAVTALLGPRLDLRVTADPAAVGAGKADVAATAVIWVHGSVAELPAPLALAAHLAGGGRLLLSGAAAGFAAELAADGPFVAGGRAADAGAGLAGLPGEPVLHRGGGRLLLRRPRGTAWTDAARCPRRPWPRDGRVLATIRDAEDFDGREPGLVEYGVGDGRLLALGLDVPFRDADPRFAEARARFFGDLFDYLASDAAAERSIGLADPGRLPGVALAVLSSSGAPLAAEAAPRPDAGDPGWQPAPGGGAGLLVRSGGAETAVVDDATGRIAAWSRSFRSLRSLELRLAGGQAPVWASVRAHADGVAWTADGGLDGWLAAADDGEGFALQWTNGGDAPLALEVFATFDLLLAGYPPHAAGSIRVGTARHGAVATFRAERVDVRAALVADQRPHRAWIQEVGDGAIGVGRCFELGPGQELLLSFGGRGPEWLADGERSAPDRGDPVVTPPVADLGEDWQAPLAAATRVVGRAELLRFAPDVVVPATVPQRWVGPLSPGAPFLDVLGALVDAEAWLVIGGAEAVGGTLELAARCRDAAGRLPRRIYATGFATFAVGDEDAIGHGAALAAAASWCAWRGDAEPLRPVRDSLCVSADALLAVGGDDAAIEGLGLEVATWVWRGLAAGATVHAAFGDAERAAACALRVEAVADAILAAFWSADDGAFRTAAVDDGDAPRDPIASLLPWCVGLGPPEGANVALRGALAAGDAAGSARLRADLLRAETRYGRPDAAWSRMDGFRAVGAAQPAEALTLLDVALRGIAGWRATIDGRRVALEPTLPGAVDRIALDAKIAGTRLRGSVSRGDDGRDLVLELEVDGAAIDLEIAPFVPAPAAVGGATLDGEPFEVHRDDVGEGFRLRGFARLEPGRHELRYAVVPDLLVATDAQPQAAFRYLGRRLTDDGELVLELECDRAIGLSVRLPGRGVTRVTGGDLDAADGLLRVAPPAGDGPRRAAVRLAFDPPT